MTDQAMEDKVNQILKKLLGDLHKYITSHTDINKSNFELPSTIQPGTPVAKHYRQAMDIYTKFEEIKGEMVSDGKQLFQLFSLIIGDGGEHNIVPPGRSQGMTGAAQTLLEQRERQNKNFYSALSEIAKIKQREQAHSVKKDKKIAKMKRMELLKIIEENKKQIERLEDENATDKKNLKLHQEATKYIDEEWKADRELLQSILAREARHPACSNNTEMAVNDGSGNIQMHGIGSPEPMEILDEYVLVAREEASMTRMDRLGHENEMSKTLLSDLHKYVTSHLEINDNPFERELKSDPLFNLSQQAQDIYQFLKTTKEKERHMDQMGKENEILKTLLSDLHKYETSHMEINDSPFELSSALRPDPPVANLYKQAQDVYYFLKEAKEIESEMVYVSKKMFELLSIIIGDGDYHKTCSTGRKRGTKDVSLSLLQQRDSQKERFQRALYLLKQMKGTQNHMDRLRNENEILKTFLSDLHRYVTSHAEINDSPFELSSEHEPDPLVANLYRQAQDVYHFLKDTKERERCVWQKKRWSWSL